MNKKQSLLTAIFLMGVVSVSCQQKVPTFAFKHHFIHNNLPTGWVNGVQTLADYDNDGDLDMTVGSKPRGMFLFVNNDTVWETIKIGDVPYTSLGAAPLDVDGDGWVDLVSAGVWYRNEGNHQFAMHLYDPEFETGVQDNSRQQFHDLVATDINGDGKLDILAEGEGIGFFWYNTNPVPGEAWERSVVDPGHTSYRPTIHGGFSPGGIGDLNGDGRPDIFNAVAWFENRDNGKSWVKHPLEFPELFTGKLPYGKSTRSVIVDIDGDGDNDIVFSECDDVHAKVGIIENLNGDGTNWKLNLLPLKAEGKRCSLHALQVADFNMDGHLDIITVDQEDMMPKDTTLHSPRWYVFTNTGKGWEEQVLFDNGLGGHDIILGDVDGDGDLDLVSKVWNPWKGSANQGKSHADYIENLTIK
jgi:hypothetical protein